MAETTENRAEVLTWDKVSEAEVSAGSGPAHGEMMQCQLRVDRYTSHVIFLMHFSRLIVCAYSLHGSSVCIRASLHPHVIHDERLFDRPFVSLCCLPLLFVILLVL